MELELELVERRSGLRVFQEETTACSEVQRIDLACVFWVSPALGLSWVENLRESSREKIGPRGSRKGHVEAASREGGRLLGFRTFGWPPPRVERFSKLGIEGSSREGRGGDTTPPSPPSEPWLSLEPHCHTAAPCCFSRAVLTSLGASFLACTSQCPAEERGAAVAVQWEPRSVAESALAVPSAGLPLCRAQGRDPSGLGGPRHPRIAKSEPLCGRTNRLQGAMPQSGGSWPHRTRCFCWILNPLVETLFLPLRQLSLNPLLNPSFYWNPCSFMESRLLPVFPSSE